MRGANAAGLVKIKRDYLGFAELAERWKLPADDLRALLDALSCPQAAVNITISVRTAPVSDVVLRWEETAKTIANRLRAETVGWTHDKLARAVRAEMNARQAEPGMVTRSGRVPSVSSILRHCFCQEGRIGNRLPIG